MEKLADGLQRLGEDDLLQVVQMVHDNKTNDTYTKNDVESELLNQSQKKEPRHNQKINILLRWWIPRWSLHTSWQSCKNALGLHCFKNRTIGSGGRPSLPLNLLLLLLKDRALFHDLESYSSEYPSRPPVGQLCRLYIIFIFLFSTTYHRTYRPYSGRNPLPRYDHITAEKFRILARICTSIEVAYISLPFWWPRILAYLSLDLFIYERWSLKADKTV